MPEALDLVVIGLGYVGLPLAQEGVRSGLRVAGYDRDPQVVRALAAGRSHVDAPFIGRKAEGAVDELAVVVLKREAGTLAARLG